MSVIHTESAPASSQAGFSLLEVLIAVAVFAIALGPITSSLITSNSLVSTNRETSIAMDAALSLVARLKAEDFDSLYRRYNPDPGDDPNGSGSAPGANFVVLGLDPVSGDPDGMVGRILFPGTGAELLENLDDVEFGTPRDLNGDGAIDAVDHGDEFIILPIKVRIEWTGHSGDRFVEFVSALTDV